MIGVGISVGISVATGAAVVIRIRARVSGRGRYDTNRRVLKKQTPTLTSRSIRLPRLLIIIQALDN